MSASSAASSAAAAAEGSDSWEDAVDDMQEQQVGATTESVGGRGAGDSNVTDQVATRAVKLLGRPCCSKNCYAGKQVELTAFLRSMEKMSKRERVSSLLTSLSVASAIGAEHAKHMRKERGKIRERFQYYLPLLGAVCKTAFMECYHISQNTISRYRARVRQRELFPAPHGGVQNMNAQVLDEKHLADWFRQFAGEVGRPIRMAMDASPCALGAESFTLLPSCFTWDALLEQYQQFVRNSDSAVRVPSAKSFQHFLKKECREICVQSGSSGHTCAQCTLYHVLQTPATSVQAMEAFAEHIYYAKVMRKEYYKDLASAITDPRHLVLSMDFAEDFALPMVPAMHSLWPFLSLLNVHMFGVLCANDRQQTNFLFSERLGERGWNEGISLLHTTLELKGVFTGVLRAGSALQSSENALEVRKLTVWTDNTDGEAKDSAIVWYLALLVETAILDEANLKFLVKDHTNSTCHGSFRAARQQVAEEELWTLPHLADEVEHADTGTRAVDVETFSKPFRDYRGFLKSRYKKLKEMANFQLFRMTKDQPGVVQYRRKPTGEAVAVDLKKQRVSPDASSQSFLELWTQIRRLPTPEPKHEKLSDFFERVAPSVPADFRGQELYQKPSRETEEIVRSIKRARTSLG